MAQLAWSEALSLDFPLMDDTHHEFVQLLAEVQNASDGVLLLHWAKLIEHTDDHFGREDEWMLQTAFASGNCHSTQHKIVLQVLREGLQHGQNGDLKMIRAMADELANWFAQHAQTMDASLALHMRRVDFDPVTGKINHPEALPKEAIQGCGSDSCSDNDAAIEAKSNVNVAATA